MADLTTLADVRELIRHLPAEERDMDRWRYVAKLLEAAARGAHTVDLVVTLRLVFEMEGVECQIRRAR